MESSRPTQREVADATAATEARMSPQLVPVNVYEAANAVVVLAPLPAVQATDVTIELDGDQLRFFAHLRSAGPRRYLVHEWEYGGYERTVDVPAGYGGGVEATLTNGQLAIRVLKGNASELVTIHPTAG